MWKTYLQCERHNGINIDTDKVIDMFEFGHIRFLTLKSLPQLASFCSEVKINSSMSQPSVRKGSEVILEKKVDTNMALFNELVVLPNLEALDISGINVERIWQDQHPTMSTSFQNLARLVVEGCRNLRYVFSSSTVRCILQLQHLEIRNCPLLEEIIFIEQLRKEEGKDIVFPRLDFLKLEDLENLSRFCSENYIHFSSLKQLQIKECRKLKAFILKRRSIGLTVGKEVEKKSTVETQPSPFFNEMVAFPALEELKISNVNNLEMIWHSKLPHNSFGKLKLIEVEGCDKLPTLFPSNMLEIFSRLESLSVGDCLCLEEIFGVQGLNFEEPHFIAIFQLQKVSVSRCPSLKNIFPAFIAKRLLQLEELKLNDCRLLEGIVAKVGHVEASTTRFVFEKVTSLALSRLPELTTLYPGIHTSEWPVLKSLTLYGCKKIKLFSLRRTNVEGQLDLSAQHSFFLVEKIFPRLEVLEIDDDMMMTWHSQFPDLFGKLKSLRIVKYEADTFALGLLESLYNLESLALENKCQFPQNESLSNNYIQNHYGNLVQIKTLKLSGIHDSKLNLTLQNLESLEVEDCHYLINLVSCSISFQNLTALHVFHCKQIRRLLTSSTAKSLEQLKILDIRRCMLMTEIVANQEDESEDDIVFSKLEKLHLLGLRSLTSFSSGKYTFKFPSLTVLAVGGCMRMKNFFEGHLSTSKLRRVWLKQGQQYERVWEGDLNTTIQRIHKNKDYGHS